MNWFNFSQELVCLFLIMNEHQLLRDSIERYRKLSDEQFNRLMKSAIERKYKKGQFIVHEGAAVRKTHFIRKGAAIAYFIDHNGAEHLIQFAIEGWWISDIHSYISGANALLNVQAIEDVELYEFSFDELQQIYQSIPEIQSYFLTITQNAFATFQQRVLHNLSLSAEQRYENFIQRYPKLELRFPQKLIASYLGISAEFLSKIKKRRNT